MNHIQEELTSERILKKFLRESDFVFLENLNKRITATLTEKRAEYEAQEAKRKERDKKRLDLLELIKAEGFSPHDLFDATASQKQAKRKPKYQYSENGVSKVWSGVGRVPVAIQQALDAGKTLDSFLI
ncbi:H-NS histone family protein [Salmonella enterica subsp. enterica serovar Wilhelmsburg]|nr:H-NS histone family protein [Salmonella enterica subsp. enterica serovar Wilhelmsburg]EDW4632783.1 H-NS histone family protein [Salmonella enterica subsp. enterica]HAK8439723.1 H-NS histone family protein [Salmonella enterica]HBJ6904403.1 H-NS histone family protein [Salmonella enterica subsp. enterica serovar Wyldegreen]